MPLYLFPLRCQGTKTFPCTLPTSAAMRVWPERWSQCRAQLLPAADPQRWSWSPAPFGVGVGSIVRLHSLSHFLLEFGWSSSETYLYPLIKGLHRDRGGWGRVFRPPPRPQHKPAGPLAGAPGAAALERQPVRVQGEGGISLTQGRAGLARGQHFVWGTSRPPAPVPLPHGPRLPVAPL